jgi:hypothetical protein
MQRVVDAANTGRKLAETQVADVKKENEMLYNSEQRVTRLIEEANEVRAQLRQRERDAGLLQEQVGRLSAQVLEGERAHRLKELEDRDELQRCQTDERVIAQLQGRVQELEGKLFESVLRQKDLEGQIKADQLRVEAAIAELQEAEGAYEQK